MKASPQIIVPIQPRNFPEFLVLTKSIINRVDMIEIWLDQLDDCALFLRDFSAFRNKVVNIDNSLKFLAVCKKSPEQGSFSGTEKERVEILQKFLESGGDFVDLDITQNSSENIQKIPQKNLWVSFHDFIGDVCRSGVDLSRRASLEKVAILMQKQSPMLYKFAIAVNTEGELRQFLRFAETFRRKVGVTSIFTTMGDLGREGRKILAEKNLTDYAFFAASEETKTAPGQSVLL